MPAFTNFLANGETVSHVGYPIGFKSGDRMFVQNHVHLIFYYHYATGDAIMPDAVRPKQFYFSKSSKISSHINF